MGWEPKKDKDPWSGKNQPPDIDEALKRLQAHFKKSYREKEGERIIQIVSLLILRALAF